MAARALPPAMSPDKPRPSACATCGTAASFRGDCERMPPDCPTLTRPDLAKDVSPYLEAEHVDVMYAANDTPLAADGRKRTRVEELIHFAHARGLKHLGVAFCVTLTREAQALGRALEAAGLTAELVCCRVGAVDFDAIGLRKAHPERFAAICNPVAQARLLNEARVELVVQLGLCLGHDLLLQEASKAPVTTLVVKDRALDHHPIEALRPNSRRDP
jgi:uncharacterized metal-binding protein